jgi:hypothetical protein
VCFGLQTRKRARTKAKKKLFCERFKIKEFLPLLSFHPTNHHDELSWTTNIIELS